VSKTVRCIIPNNRTPFVIDFCFILNSKEGNFSCFLGMKMSIPIIRPDANVVCYLSCGHSGLCGLAHSPLLLRVLKLETGSLEFGIRATEFLEFFGFLEFLGSKI